MNLELLSELCETPGPSGREEPIRQVVRRELEPLAAEVSVDPLGNLVAVRPGRGGPRLMLSAHMDEIGFMVTHVDDAGFLRLITLGGFDPKTLTAQRVLVHGREDLVGVMGSKPVHLMSDDDKRRAAKLEDSVQEEVGLRGARVATARARPDIGLAIDTTLANDVAEAKPHERITTLGGGAAVKVYDAGTIVPRRVVDHLVAVAGERGIPHQLEVMARGSTDTRELALSGEGAPAGCVSIPTRYIHQVVETCHPGDIDACVSLVAGFCETAQDLVEADLSRR